jgi:DNA-binding NtrC family response regulator
LRGVIKEAALKTTGRTVLLEFLPPGLAEGSADSAIAAMGNSIATAPELDVARTIDGLLQAGDNGIYNTVVKTVERELIARVLKHSHGHLGKVCERLGIDRKTLRNKLRELGLSADKDPADAAD